MALARFLVIFLVGHLTVAGSKKCWIINSVDISTWSIHCARIHGRFRSAFRAFHIAEPLSTPQRRHFITLLNNGPRTVSTEPVHGVQYCWLRKKKNHFRKTDRVDIATRVSHGLNWSTRCFFFYPRFFFSPNHAVTLINIGMVRARFVIKFSLADSFLLIFPMDARLLTTAIREQK